MCTPLVAIPLSSTEHNLEQSTIIYLIGTVMMSHHVDNGQQSKTQTVETDSRFGR